MPRPVRVQRSRSYAVSADRAYERVLPIDLATIFSRFGPLPAVTGVREQIGPWSTVGQTRLVQLGDGSQMTEELISVQPGSGFAYRITEPTGPMRFLVASIDGRWEFDPTPGGGSSVTWSWDLHPRGLLAWPFLQLVGLFWRGYATRSLERLAETLDG